MYAFLAAVATALLLAIVAMLVLDGRVQRQSDQSFQSISSVRMPDHGATHNLVGRDWYSASKH